MSETGGHFVDAVVKDPSNPPKVRLIVGYQGKSATDGQIRIYANPELSSHIDVASEAVLHSQAVPNDPLGAKYFWVKQDADVTRRDSNQVEVRAKFLSGPLAAAQPAGAAAPMGPGVGQVSLNIDCPGLTFNPTNCPSLDVCASLACITQSPPRCPPLETRIPLLCPTHDVRLCHTHIVRECAQSLISPCNSNFVICRTQDIQCRTLAGPNCVTILSIHCQTNPAFCLHTFRDPGCVQITRNGCFTNFTCPTTGACPSAVDACPSSFGCPPIDITFNPLG